MVKTRNKSRRSNIEITGTYPFSVRKEAEQEENASVFFNVNVKTGDERHHDPIIIRVSVWTWIQIFILEEKEKATSVDCGVQRV